MRDDKRTLRVGQTAALAGTLMILALGCGKDGGEPAKRDGVAGPPGAAAKPNGAEATQPEGANGAAGDGAAVPDPNAPPPAASFDGDQLIHDCEESSFESDKASQDVFVVWFHADWCPSCEKQRRELEPLSRSSIKGRPVICRYDYDETEDLQGKLRVQRQSSFIRYVKGTEQARSVGETGKERLIKFLEG